jgi:hypothetical protein
VDWIAGHWQGEAFGGIAEEIWTAPLGGSMMGSFKLVIDGSVKFYELCTIAKIDSTIILRLKHFHNDLKGWEEKDKTVDFNLIKVTPYQVFFDGFTFERINDNEMNLYVVIHSSSGEAKETMFNYKRVREN